MLTDKNGTTYQLSGDTAKLSDHVGHEIKVTWRQIRFRHGAVGRRDGHGGIETDIASQLLQTCLEDLFEWRRHVALDSGSLSMSPASAAVFLQKAGLFFL